MADENIIVANTLQYGAMAGEVFINGMADTISGASLVARGAIQSAREAAALDHGVRQESQSKVVYAETQGYS